MVKLIKMFFSLIIFMLMSPILFKYFWTALHRIEISVPSYERGEMMSTVFRLDQRQKGVLKQCAELNQTIAVQNGTTSQDIRVLHKDFIMGMTDKQFSFVYCRVSKAASSFTISSLCDLLGYYSAEELRGFSVKFRHLPYDQMKKTFNSALTFMFVREPYGRIFSTYANKFYFPKGNWAPIGTEAVKRYRKNASEDSLNFGHDITFVELVRYIVDEFEAGRKMDEHIRPMHLNCKPCEYNYDFIGKLETMVPDWKYLLHLLKSRNIIGRIPPNQSGKPTKKTFSEMRHFLRIRNKMKSSNINIYNLYKRIWRYYKISSVIAKEIEVPFTGTNKDEIKYTSFLKELEKAAEHSKVNAAELKTQKHEAMLQAYSTVPLELLERLRHVVLEDCLIYGYEDRPDWVFVRTKAPSLSTFDYFSDL